MKKIEAVWETENKSLASKLEFNIKKLKKVEKEEMIINKNLSKYLSGKVELERYTFMPDFLKSFSNE